MKKYIFAYLLLILLFMVGCQNSKPQEYMDESTYESPFDKNTIVMFYGLNSSSARIDDIEKIKELTELVNKAEFIKCTDTIDPLLYLSIQFYEKEGVRSYHIDKNNIIKLSDGTFAKAKNINFDMLYSIYKDYQTKINVK